MVNFIKFSCFMDNKSDYKEFDFDDVFYYNYSSIRNIKFCIFEVLEV